MGPLRPLRDGRGQQQYSGGLWHLHHLIGTKGLKVRKEKAALTFTSATACAVNKRLEGFEVF